MTDPYGCPQGGAWRDAYGVADRAGGLVCLRGGFAEELPGGIVSVGERGEAVVFAQDASGIVEGAGDVGRRVAPEGLDFGKWTWLTRMCWLFL